MNRIKHFMILALALAMSLGAWAQQEVLLTTVTATGETSYSQSPDGIVTVTLNNIVYYNDAYGWLENGTVTVEAAQGYTITRCVFKQFDPSVVRELADDQAPFTATMADYTVSVETSTGPVIGGNGMDGITSIEVYGYAADPSPTVTHNADGSWGFTMPGYDAALNVSYYLLPDLAWTYNSAAMPAEGLTAYRGFELPVIQNIMLQVSDTFNNAMQGYFRLDQVSAPWTWMSNNDNFVAADMANFVDNSSLTEEQVLTFPNPDPTANQVCLIYGFDGYAVKYVLFNGTNVTAPSQVLTKSNIYNIINAGAKIFYTTSTVVRGLTLRYGSSNPAVVSFSNPNNMSTFRVNGTGEADIYAVFDGDTTFLADSVAFHVTVADPATLTLAANGNGSVSALMGGDATQFHAPADWNGQDTEYPTTEDFPGFLATTQEEAMALATGVSDNMAIVIYDQDSDDRWYYIIRNNDSYSPKLTNLAKQAFYACEESGTAIYYTTGGTDIVALVGQEGKYLVIPGTQVQVVAEAQDGNYVQAWSDNRQPQHYTSDTNTITVSGSMNLTATFAQNPLLTLAADGQGSGTVEFDGYTPAGLGTEQLNAPSNWSGDYMSISTGEMPNDFQPVDENVARAWQNTTGKDVYLLFEANAYPSCIYFYANGTQSDNSNTLSKNMAANAVANGKLVLYTTGVIPATYPDGIAATETENTYRVLPGTQVKVIATPDSAHYFVNWDEETALNSNTAVEKTLTMGTDNMTLTANFAAKPTLTLAANNSDWGSVEVAKANEVENMTIGTGGSLYTGTHFNLAYTAHQHASYGVAGFTMKSGQNATITATDGKVISKVVLSVTAGSAYNQSTTTSAGTIETEWAGSTITINGINATEVVISNTNSTGVTATNVAIYYQGTELPAGVVDNGDGTYRVDYGTEVTVIATANAGYHMDSWSNDDEVTNLLSDTAETITMTEDVTLTATFAQNPTLTIASNNSEWGSLDIEGVGSGKDKFVTDANQLVYTGRHVKVTATDLYDVGVIRLKDEGQQATIETLNGEIIDSIVVTASMNTHNCSYVLSTSGTVQGGNPTTKIRNINAASVVLTAQYGVGISNITVYYTSPDNIDVVAIDYESGIYSVLPGTEVTVNATANEGYYVTGWKDENNSDMATATYSEGLYPVTSSLSFTVTGDTTSMAIFEQSFISPELAWSAETFTAYTTIDFNNWKPTLTNPQNLDVRYGCVEGSVITEGGIPVDEITGIIGAELGIGTVSTKAGTYHIYAVHDFDGNYDYDSVVYTLVVENSATVLVQKNIEEGGAVDFVEPENDLTHNYTNSATLKSVFLAPGADFSVINTAAEGYHFAKWQTGDNVNGYTDYSTEPNLTYTAPAEFTGNFVVGLKAVFDTNVYNVAYNVQNDTRPQIGTNAPMGSVVVEGQHKHFLNDVLTATAADGYIFAGWANTSGTVVSTENPFVFSPVSDTTLTATFIVGDYTLNATPNIPTSGQVTGSGSYAYRSTVTLEATPSAGYHFVNWVDGSGNVLGTNNELSVQLLSDSSVIAVFDTNVYNVAYNVQNDTRPQVGTNAPMGSVVVEGQHKHFLNDVLTATAADGYIFAGWANTSGTVVSTENPFVFSPVSDTTLTATFTVGDYTLNATPNIPTSGQVTGNGSYAYRSTVTLEATPSAGYHFVNWVDGSGNVLGTSTELSVQLLSDVSVIAVFDTNIYNVMANVNIAGLGTVTGAGQVKHFLSTNLVATANLGYHFVHWIDNAGNELGTANTITVFPVSDTVLTAVFEANIYSTVWSGSSTTTYNSQPYTGLVAKYIDFQGNEHTPMLTFTNGSTTITTPNYPVNAGTWTVTATGEVGDVLTNTVNTLVINPAVVYVSNAVVETAKFVDGNTDAVVTNIGTLNNVQGNDVVTHNTTAVFNDATVGEGKTITLTYSLNGDSELLANYNLDPATQVYTTNAYIIEPMTPDTNRVSTEDTTVVEEGMDIYAYGYCSGSTYSIRYHLNSGNPDQYKIDFADNRFTDVDWTDLTIAGTDGTIDIEVPVDLPTGDYTLTVTFRDSRFTWLESKPISVSFHVNLPETYTVVLFDNVIALVDTCHCFTDIQWYHRADASSDWYAIPGATGYYYHATDAQLKGEFFVKVRMNGIETYTCPQTDMETLYSDNEQSVSVKAYPNPATERVTIAISGSTEPIHKLRIINNLGVEMESITFEGDSTVINMSNYQQGNYMVTVDGAVVIVIRN